MHTAIRLTFVLAACLSLASPCTAAELVWGHWDLELETPGGPLPVKVHIKRNGDMGQGEWSAEIINGSERISVACTGNGDDLTLDMPHYDSRIVLSKSDKTAKGKWTKTRGAGDVATVKVTGHKHDDLSVQPTSNDRAIKNYLGRFEVHFADSEDPAVAVFEKRGPNQIAGTFMTTTGDYRYLFGTVDEGGKLVLSCFDGAHAFLFHATHQDGSLVGDFWSGNWYHTTWKAIRNPKAQLADGFAQVSVNESVRLSELRYIDLLGEQRTLGDADLRGKVTIVELFGSWCPNCHDAASLLGELHNKHKAQGLEIIGLGFELTGDQTRDTRQLTRYRDRFGIKYPILLAGLADKVKASHAFPLIDRIRSYPTTIFIDQTGKVRSVYSGFSGPATGRAHQELRAAFEEIVRKLLSE